jgi:hypothetical protein
MPNVCLYIVMTESGNFWIHPRKLGGWGMITDLTVWLCMHLLGVVSSYSIMKNPVETYHCTHRGCPETRTNTRRPFGRHSPPPARPLGTAIPAASGTISLHMETKGTQNQQMDSHHQYFALTLKGKLPHDYTA